MIEKIPILIFIFSLLLAFYFVIYWGSGKKNKSTESSEIKSYMFGVRTLILILAIVGFLLWLFL
tara:strand:- start:2722 stop:2913 length:192 start_codon:yes stop_codon:yes gene_type:complete